jgi:hypothetical protein
MNTIGTAVKLTDTSSNLWSGSSVSILHLVIAATLAGTLTITGICATNGQPVAWSLPPGTTAGVYAAPGSGDTGGALLAYSLSDPTDSGMAVIAFAPKN